jgi:hypothetical protein
MLNIAAENQYDDLIEALSPEDVRTAECLYCLRELGVCECIPGEQIILSEELYECITG